MKLSIIIPVYRAASTLDRCVQSIVDQTFVDWEAILVDDGSPDDCPAMCDRWAARDPRISVVHRQNGGLSAARNTGIERALGDCITFVDSDDYVAKETYAKVMPLTAESDIVEFPVWRFYGAPQQQQLTFSRQRFKQMADYWLKGQAYTHCYAWNKVYRRTLFDEVRFPEGRVFEDVATLPLLLDRATAVTTCNEGLYYYCMNPHGITQTATGADLEMLLESHLAALDRWADDAYYMHVVNIQMDVCRLTGHAPRLPRRHVSPLAGGLPLTARLKAVVLYLLGIKGLCRINQFTHRT